MEDKKIIDKDGEWLPAPISTVLIPVLAVVAAYIVLILMLIKWWPL